MASRRARTIDARPERPAVSGALGKVVTVVATLLLWAAMMRVVGRIPFTETMTVALVETAAALGVYGIEAIEDLYLSVLALITLAASILIVRTFLRHRRLAAPVSAGTTA
ncbi:hypothetical protein ACFSGX_02470 [Sphingomonas arantia]|uniref:Uncharacterized protein n=1 Tax=Sphingomonas arantia TaxID=1460676 RepID=A0ABW4TXA4_9SPHN